MSDSLEAAIAKIRSIADEYCETQMYYWPGFDPEDPNPEDFFEREGIQFDGILYIRFPVKRAFNPIPLEQIEAEEHSLGARVPEDYKTLLHTFGAFHIPGPAEICLMSPAKAFRTTQGRWCVEDAPLSALAISEFSDRSDGNNIGFLRNGDRYGDELFEFDHELRYRGDDPKLWTEKVAASLSDFLIEYLDRT